MSDQEPFAFLLDAWDRNNRIMVGVLRALPDGALAARSRADGPTVAQLFTHIQYTRLAAVGENAPEYAEPLPEPEWRNEQDREQLATMLDESALTVRTAIRDLLAQGHDLDPEYDHPSLLIQHLIWHEGYHLGQLKLALIASGFPMSDRDFGPLSWDIWRHRTKPKEQ